MKLIVGLGNPGTKYERTRHNAGFRAVRAFHTLHADCFDSWREKFKSILSEGRLGSEKIILLLPQTYMNLSGEAVKEAMNFWKLEAKDLIIITDDLSLPIGKIRIRRDGSAGGHNGLKNIFNLLETENITRIKIGIENSFLANISAEKFVLESFSAEDESALAQVLPETAKIIETIITKGVDEAMNQYN